MSPRAHGRPKAPTIAEVARDISVPEFQQKLLSALGQPAELQRRIAGLLTLKPEKAYSILFYEARHSMVEVALDEEHTESAVMLLKALPRVLKPADTIRLAAPSLARMLFFLHFDEGMDTLAYMKERMNSEDMLKLIDAIQSDPASKSRDDDGNMSTWSKFVCGLVLKGIKRGARPAPAGKGDAPTSSGSDTVFSQDASQRPAESPAASSQDLSQAGS